MFRTLFTLTIASSPLIALASTHVAGRHHSISERQLNVANTSVLPPGWSGASQCYADCTLPSDTNPLNHFLLGPTYVNSTSMTIELCVGFCDEQNTLMAGLIGDKCWCSNIFSPISCFESGDDCRFNSEPCPGNPAESCGGPNSAPVLINIFFKGDLCAFLWDGGALMTSGPWRLAYFYNDTVGARALPHNAVNLDPPLKRGNLTVEACVNACGAAGFLLAGVEFADECYCGNELENNSQPISECVHWPANAAAMPCKGDPEQFCGGPDLLYVYTLPGSGVGPLVPFDPIFDGYCPGCSQFGFHT